MKEFFAFLTAACVLGIVQWMSAVAWAVFLVLLLMSTIVRPRVTFSFIASMGLLAMALQRPGAMTAALAAIGVAVIVCDRVRRRPAPSANQQLRLTGG